MRPIPRALILHGLGEGSVIQGLGMLTSMTLSTSAPNHANRIEKSLLKGSCIEGEKDNRSGIKGKAVD